MAPICFDIVYITFLVKILYEVKVKWFEYNFERILF